MTDSNKPHLGADSVEIVNFADIREKNGKTIRENNLELTHKIPLGTLVEINHEDSKYHGLRVFVVRHDRDCDGTPLYALSFDKDICQQIENYKACEEIFMRQIAKYEEFKIFGAYGEESLIDVYTNIETTTDHEQSMIHRIAKIIAEDGDWKKAFTKAELILKAMFDPGKYWDELPRQIVFWLDMEPKTPKALFRHLNNALDEVPEWISKESEMNPTSTHVPSKGTRAVLIWKAFIHQMLKGNPPS